MERLLTTIAASLDHGTMAADSRVSVEHKGIDYPAIKIVRGKGSTLIGAAGHAGDCSRFLAWARNKFDGKEPKWHEPDGQEDSVIGMVMSKDGIYVWSQGDPEPERVEARVFAIGSGGKAARVALALGKSPEEAVALACTVDPYSAPPVQTLALEGK